MSKIDKNLAKFELYKRGVLTWKLDPFQKEVHKQLTETQEKITVVLSSRRLGKSWLAVLMAIEQCLKQPNSIVKFLAPTKLQVNNTIRPLIKAILEDAPEEFKPAFIKAQYTFFFPNGSELQLSGSDNGHAEKLRGGFCSLAIIDEAQDCNDLTNTVRSILIPTTLNTRGKILIIGTYPKDLEHDFLKFVEEAEGSHTLIKKTIYDNPRIKPEEIEEIIAAYPDGENDPDFKREFKCVVSRDGTRTVIPEFTEELEKEIVKEWERPPYFDGYVGMDIGGKDLTALVFAYFDFKANKVIIEDELEFDFKKHGNSLEKLVKQIHEKEDTLWLNKVTNEIKKPTVRVSDINPIVIGEISQLSTKLYGKEGGIDFITAQKDDPEAALNKLRMMLGNKQIIINPKCKNLIAHLKNAKWHSNTNRSVFARSPIYGHYDFCHSAQYLIRTIAYSKNPYPSDYGYNLNNLYVSNPDKFYSNNTLEIYKKLFNIRK